MQKFKIGVIGGLGHIGLIQAACLAKLGYKTIAYDRDEAKISGVLKGKIPFYEAGLEELVVEATGRGLLKFTSKVGGLQEVDIIFSCVGTPPLPSGEADLSQVYSAIEQVARNRSKPCIVVNKSTVPVGTARKLTDHLIKLNLSDKVTMVSSPEFLREGTGVEDFWKPARIVVGSQKEETSEKVAKLFAPKGVPIISTTWENAEIIKLASNAFLSTKISFINEIALLTERVGADIRVVSKGIGLDPRINPYFIEAGVGFSGPCLEKDLQSLIDQIQKVGRKARILEAVYQVNEGQRRAVVEKLEHQLGSLRGRKIAVFGMAFKAETDDVRLSHSLPIVKHLLALEAKLALNDPGVSSLQEAGLSKDEFPGVEWVTSPYEAAKGAEAILILTAWPEYKRLDLARLKADMKKPLIVDGRNMFEPKEMQAQEFIYLGVGI